MGQNYEFLVKKYEFQTKYPEQFIFKISTVIWNRKNTTRNFLSQISLPA
jgi:hypothetical protein